MNKSFSETKKTLIDLYHASRSGHIGGGISILPALYSLFSGQFNPKRDKIVFSKGHCVAALYVTLNAAGFLSDQMLATFYTDNTKLGAHTPSHLVPFIPFATGSLGHGPSLTNGLGLAKKLLHEPGHIYCFCGDGEWQEGACWEAITFAVKHKLDNITIIIDCNGWQGFGSLTDVSGIDIDGMEKRLSAFDAHVIKETENDTEKLKDALFITYKEKPLVILVKSIKGEGLFEFENTLASHYVSIDDNLYFKIKEREKINEKKSS